MRNLFVFSIVALCLSLTERPGLAQSQLPSSFPFVGEVGELPVDEGTYISIGSEVLIAPRDAETVPPIVRTVPYLVALNRDFVNCFSRYIQGLEDGDRVLELLEFARNVSTDSKVSGWGFDYQPKTMEVIYRLFRKMSVGLSGAYILDPACSVPKVFFFPLYEQRKIDPSIELPVNRQARKRSLFGSVEGMETNEGAEAEIVVTKYSDLTCPIGGVWSEMYFDEGWTARAFLRGLGEISEVARNSCVKSIERFPEVGLRQMGGHSMEHNEHLSCEVVPGQAAFPGRAQIAGLIDMPIDVNHCSFSDLTPPGANHRKIIFDEGAGRPGPPVEARFHGTMVAGLLAGDPPNSDPSMRGAAPKAKIAFSPLASFKPYLIRRSLDAEYDEGARVFSMSWGDSRCPGKRTPKPKKMKSTTGRSGGHAGMRTEKDYDEGPCLLGGLTRAFDAFAAANEDVLIVAADSNSDRIGMPENGLNVLAVAASGSDLYECSRFVGASGRTPVGQSKPDFVAPGCHVKAAIPGSLCRSDFAPPALDSEYGNLESVDCATSWAAPIVAGRALQLREFLSECMFRPERCGAWNRCEPTGAQLKSLLVASGSLPKEVRPGGAAGWGSPDVSKVALADRPSFLVDVRRWDRGFALTEGAWVGPYGVEILPCGDVDVALAWTEPAYGPNVGLPINSDLDLYVEVYRNDDFIDRIEGVSMGGPAQKVSLRNLNANRLNIYVRGTRVVADTPFTAFQGYSLSAVGAIASAGFGRPGRCETRTPLRPSRNAPSFSF